MATVGSRLRDERERLSLNQSETAKIGGASKNTQLSYEAGKSSPNADYLVKIGEYGFDIFYILTGSRMRGGDGEAGNPRVVIYEGFEDAFEAVLSIQEELGLQFKADQLKQLIGIAYRGQIPSQELKEFVENAFLVTGAPLPKGE